jgi:hypothetical protein
MKHLVLLFIMASLPMISNANLGLGSSRENIKKKATSIEKDYSRSMRQDSYQQDESVPMANGDVSSSDEDEFAEFQEIPAESPRSVSSPSYSNSSSSSNGSSSMNLERIFGEPGPGMKWIEYGSTLKMRDDRKVGVGMSVGGATGLMGLNVELNFEDADGVVAGFGTGPGYNSVQLAWKHAFEGDYIAPYAMGGYSRWYNSNGSDEASKSDILDRVLTDDEKKSGRFGTDFVFGSAGLQYNQLSGPLAGISFYAEILLMAEIKTQDLIPTGGVGTTYFF